MLECGKMPEGEKEGVCWAQGAYFDGGDGVSKGDQKKAICGVCEVGSAL